MDFRKEAELLGIGNTPLIKFEEEFDGDIYVKHEGMNASGSVKDRAAFGMIIDAEQKGMLHKGDTIVEATSGNMGIALAYVGIKRGYRVKLTMPSTMTVERRQILQGLGAELVLTDGALGMKGAIDAVEQLSAQKGHVWLKQFENPANVTAHYLSTGAELLEQLDQIDVLVAGVGTGGTLIGTGKRIREKFPHCEIVAVEPSSSPVISKGVKGAHKIQGIGAGFVPKTFNAEVCDEIMTVSDDEAFDFARAVCKTEGVLVGISSGAALAAAVRLAKRGGFEGKAIVVVFPDGGDRYISTGLFDSTP